MGGTIPKQYLKAAGKTLLEHSLAALLALDWVDGVIVGLAAGDTTFGKLPCAKDARIRLATGGATRADSVLAGLRQVPAAEKETFVLVHDAARPCVTRGDIQRLRDEASDADGGLLAAPVADTLKRAESSRSAATVDRRDLWAAQTPQMFRLDLLRTALETCKARGIEVTDEAAAMEAMGHHPRLVNGRRSNLKVTYADDLALAEFWLSRPENQR